MATLIFVPEKLALAAQYCPLVIFQLLKVHTLGDNGGTGGGEEPEQPPDAYINDSFITSSGALIINNDIDYDPNKRYITVDILVTIQWAGR